MKSMGKREKEKPVILYEKYKQENNMVQPHQINIEKKKHSGSMISNLLLVMILVAMIGLSAIGVIILAHPEGRELLINIINS